MKNRFLLTVVLLLAGALVGAVSYYAIDHYYETHSRSVTAETDQFIADAGQRSIIPVEFEVAVPPETPTDQPLFLSGSEPALGNWEAAGVPLVRGEDGKYRAVVEITQGVDYSYKITRGTWGTVEKGPGGEEIPDRTLHCDEPQVVAVTVASWVDGGKAIPYRISTSGDLRVHRKLQSSILGNERNLIVYLPPGYEHTERRYPVLYLHDGQNLFDESTSYAGVEWQLDEAAQRLISDGRIEPLIIVGIYNTPDRSAEFTPPPTGRADEYARFIVEEVKPFVDRLYRTRSDRDGTGIGGSSMGGLPTLYAAKAHPDVFSKVALLTPFLRVDGEPVAATLNVQSGWLKGMRVWLDMGPSPAKYYPGEDPVGDARALVAMFESAGLVSGVDYRFVEVTNGEHNEASWQTRVPDVLMFLYGATDAEPTTAPTAAR
jgi:enterochelin esterase-like enzyme